MPVTARAPSQEAFAKALENHLAGASPPPHAAASVTAEEVRRGVPLERLEALKKEIGVTQKTITRVLSISERTLQRRRDRGRLMPVESDRFGRLVRIWRRALQAFDGNSEEARHWLRAPKQVFDGHSPVEQLDTEPGTRMVEEMLMMIDQTMPV